MLWLTPKLACRIFNNGDSKSTEMCSIIFEEMRDFQRCHQYTRHAKRGLGQAFVVWSLFPLKLRRVIQMSAADKVGVKLSYQKWSSEFS